MDYSEGLENATFEVDAMVRDYIVYWAELGLKGCLQDHFARAVRYSIQEVSVKRDIDRADLEKIYETTTLSRGANTATPPTVTPPPGGGFSA